MRIQEAKPRGLFTRIVFWMCRRQFGKVPGSLRAAARHDRVLAGTVHMERHQAKARKLDLALKSLVQIRAATLIGCPF